MVRFIAHEVGNLVTNFGVSGTFHSRVMGQHLSVTSRDLETLTFDLGGRLIVAHELPLDCLYGHQTARNGFLFSFFH